MPYCSSGCVQTIVEPSKSWAPEETENAAPENRRKCGAGENAVRAGRGHVNLRIWTRAWANGHCTVSECACESERGCGRGAARTWMRARIEHDADTTRKWAH